ncbi:MAG: RNA-directed DNA polymerase, partial [Methylococcales bacterium]|nr:RNA-directed DNA polymerase [Methylococcales bacterium]
ILSKAQLKEVVERVLEFEEVFVGPDGRVGFNNRVQHKIRLEEGARPHKAHPWKASFYEKEHVGKEIQKLLEAGQIQPSKSPWGAAVVLVKKKDGTLRFCIDFRRLNDVTIKDAYPLPRIEECLDALNGSRYFSTLDLHSGYWQVAMSQESKEMTAFTTSHGLFEWNVMPFGLCNSPASFSRLMEQVLADVVWTRCLVYLDDIVAFGSTFDIALLNLTCVLERLRTANLKLKATKCEFFRTRVEYLGHEVSAEGIRPSPNKVVALSNWKMPETLAEVRIFVGFSNYYRRFVKNYSAKAAPLTQLTRKNAPFKVTEEVEGAFEAIKEDLVKVPLLHYARPNRPYWLDTDASLYAIGAVISQQDDQGVEVPLAYSSKTLNSTRQRYCTTKREL